MEKYDNTTSVISISSKNINCSKVVELLKKQKIVCSVSENASVQCDTKKNICWIEEGCNITLGGLKPEFINPMVWEPLKKEFNLDCAHLWIHGKYRGCVESYPNKCSTSYFYNFKKDFFKFPSIFKL